LQSLAGTALLDDLSNVRRAPDAGNPFDRVGCVTENRRMTHGFSLAPGIAASEDVLAPLKAYVAGHATGDPAHFRLAFLPTAHVEGLRDGEFVSWDLETYCGLFVGTPAADEAGRTRVVDQLEVTGDVATATMTLRHGENTFTDAFVLIRAGEGWWIANKVYERRATPAG
jgi:hypothetical protein